MASPVVRPFYDPAYDFGTPVITTYWSAFLGERSAMNKAIMADRMKKADPSVWNAIIEQSQKRIAALEEQRSKIALNATEGFFDFWTARERGLWQAKAQAIAAEAKMGVAYTQAEVAAEKISAEDRRYFSGLRQVATGEEAALTTLENQITNDKNLSGDDLLLQYRQNLDVIARANGYDEGSPEYEALKYKIAAIAKRIGEAEHREAGYDDIARIWYGGKDPIETFTTAFPVTDDEAKRRRERILSHGVSMDWGTTGGLQFLPPTQGGVPQTPGGAYGAPGAVQGGGGGGSMAAPPAGQQQPATGGHGYAAPQAAATSPMGQVYQQWMGVVAPSLGGIDQQLTGAKADLASAIAQRNAAMQVESDPFAGFRENYLLETPFQGTNRQQAIIDDLARQDPRVIEELVDRLARSGGRPGRALRTEGQPPRPGPDIKDMQVPTSGEFIFRWMADELAQATAEMSAPASYEQGRQRMMVAGGVAEGLPPEVLRQAPADLMNMLRSAKSMLDMEEGGDRLAQDKNWGTPGGNYLYLQKADGTVYWVTDPNTGEYLPEPVQANAQQAQAITAMIGPHPAQTGTRKGTAAYLRAATTVANQASAQDVHFGEALSARIENAYASDDPVEVVNELKRTADWANFINMQAGELGGPPNDGLAYQFALTVATDVQAQDARALREHTLAFQSEAMKVALAAEDYVPREVRDSFRSDLDATLEASPVATSPAAADVQTMSDIAFLRSQGRDDEANRLYAQMLAGRDAPRSPTATEGVPIQAGAPAPAQPAAPSAPPEPLPDRPGLTVQGLQRSRAAKAAELQRVLDSMKTAGGEVWPEQRRVQLENELSQIDLTLAQMQANPPAPTPIEYMPETVPGPAAPTTQAAPIAPEPDILTEAATPATPPAAPRRRAAARPPPAAPATPVAPTVPSAWSSDPDKWAIVANKPWGERLNIASGFSAEAEKAAAAGDAERAKILADRAVALVASP